MTSTPTPRHPVTPTRSSRPRRGAAYLLVLGAGVLLSSISAAILVASRGASQSASQSADLDEAAMLAEAAVAWGTASVDADAGWRTAYTHNVESTRRVMGRGTLAFKLVDRVDGNLSNNTSDAVQVYGIGRVGSAVRTYRVELTGTGATLDVLKAAVHSAGNLTVIDNVTATGGALSSNGTITVNSGKIVTGDVEGIGLSVIGNVTGARTTLTSAKPMPNANVFDTYKAIATVLSFPSGGGINKKVLSPGTNTIEPAAGLNADGVYYIKVPASGTLSITLSRLVATLVVELEPGGKLVTNGAFAWEPARADFPTLIVKGSSASSGVTLGGATGNLMELTNFTNFNPPGTPYPYNGGTADTNQTGNFPSGFNGLLHVIGSGVPVSMASNFTVKGGILVDGTLSVGAGVKLTVDPVLAASPPAGYTAATKMVPSAASWRWEAP